MMYFLDALLCLVLLTLGYVAVCYYFNEAEWSKFRFSLLKLTANRIFYLVVGVAASAVMILCFHRIYNLPLISRWKLLTLTMIILPCAAVDNRVQKIPNRFLLVGLVCRCAYFVAEFIASPGDGVDVLKDCCIGALVIGLFFLLLLFMFKNSIGMGDVKLFALMGLFQGVWGTVNSVFFSLLASFFLAIGLLITRKKGRKDTIAFGPSIYIGTVLAVCLAGM